MGVCCFVCKIDVGGVSPLGCRGFNCRFDLGIWALFVWIRKGFLLVGSLGLNMVFLVWQGLVD